MDLNIKDIFEIYPVLFPTLCIISGLVIGSFLNVVIYRVPIILNNMWREECIQCLEIDNIATDSVEHINLLYPRSHCPKCKKPIKWYHNIPIISYILLKAKCSNCQTKISLNYPLVEILTACFFVIQGLYFDLSFEWLVSCILTSGLIALSMIDIEHKLLPDQLTLPMLWLGLNINIFHTFTSLDEAVIGATVGYISLWSFASAYKKITKKPAMGHGDFKLLACGGAWLGWEQLPFIVLAASLVASIIGLILILTKYHTKESLIPFGPYLSAAIWASLIWGDNIMITYYTLFDLG